MKGVILAGGFGKRLGDLTKDMPKPLLPVDGKPVIEYALKEMQDLDDIETVYVLTIERFRKHFENWAQKLSNQSKLKLLIEPVISEEQNLGTIWGLNFFIDHEHLNEDLMVVAGDTLFDFKLIQFLKFFEVKSGSTVACYDMGSLEKVRRKYGVVQLDENQRIVDFEEKPANPKSSLASTACYIFTKTDLVEVSTYLADGENPDAPGYFIGWLSKRKPVYGFTFDGMWYDIGHPETYDQANKYVSQINKQN